MIRVLLAVAVLLTVSTTGHAAPANTEASPPLVTATMPARPEAQVATHALVGGAIGGLSGLFAGGVVAVGSAYAIDARLPPCADCEGYLGPEINSVFIAMYTLPVGALAGVVVGILVGLQLDNNDQPAPAADPVPVG